MKTSPALIAALASAITFAGCGGDDADDHDHDEDPDAAVEPAPDANEDEPDAALEPDAEPAPDAPDSPLPDPTPLPVRLSMTNADGFNGVTFGPDGSFYAIGYTTIGASDRATVFAKFTPAGALDTSWGSAGVVTVNVTVGGGTAEVGRAIAIQPGGKLVGVALIEADIAATGPAASDRNVAVIRLDASGGLDPTFDTDGVRTLSFNTGVLNGANWAGADDIRDVEIDSTGRIILFGGQLTTETDGAPRFDTDWVAQRLTVDGADDTSFNAAGAVPGKFTLDVLNAGASVRSGSILPDGSIIGTGYANTTAFNSTQPVIYKLTTGGVLDTTFAEGAGFFHEQVLLFVTEVYGVALQGDKLVTTGYGRDTSTETTDWVSLRLDANGTLDSTWGTGGKVRIDFHAFGDNSRSLVALPGGRVMLTGSGDLAAADARDAKVVVLAGNGEYDTTFRTDGILGYDLGGTNDAFWSSAVSPDGTFAVVVGTKGVAAQTAASNDDAAIMVIPLED